MLARRPVALALALALLFGALIAPTSMFAASPPILSLPIPSGETWQVIQGYNCGTHTNYDDNAFDLVNTAGRTRGAPVLAAADGTFWWWGDAGGSMIIAHGNGYYTMYSHMESHVPFAKGQFIARGTVIGAAGSAGASHSNPHLHFEMFHGDGISASNRYGVPLAFVEGYNFPDHNVCNEYMGVQLTAAPGAGDTTPPTIPTLLDPGQGQNQIVRWNAATDEGSGVHGYQLYVGPDPAGVGEWFIGETLVALPTLDPGRYYVRIRALDNVGNASAWATLLEVDL
jgi:murein DD-endopeptidase MepM/ murein hydrolase activator NlpD